MILPMLLGSATRHQVAVWLSMAAVMLSRVDAKQSAGGSSEIQSIRRHLSEAFDGLENTTQYGAMTPGTVGRIFKLLHLSPSDVFCHCASGSGRIVMQAALETPVKRAIGIEDSPHNHGLQELALKRLKKLEAQGALAHPRSELEFVKDNLATWHGLTSADGCNKIFMANAKFPKELNMQLASRLLAHQRLVHLPKPTIHGSYYMQEHRMMVVTSGNWLPYFSKDRIKEGPCSPDETGAYVTEVFQETIRHGALFVYEICPGSYTNTSEL